LHPLHVLLAPVAALVQERSKIYGSFRKLDSFKRAVESLSTSGEEGRRRGFGQWLTGDLEGAVSALANYQDDDVAAFTRANALMSLERFAEAASIFEALSKKYPAEPRPRGGWLDAQLEAGLASGKDQEAVAALKQQLENAPADFAESAEGLYMRARLEELERNTEDAIDLYREAHRADPTHRRNAFRLAYLAERSGFDQLALRTYETVATMLPIDRTVMTNLGLLYEDLGRDQDAATCYDTVVRNFPNDRRAKLYLQDALAGIEMYYDEDMEKKEDRLNQILRIPITDFELSVRARNCLSKMNIVTLGDLVRQTEHELLSYKNFGETSLTEIKEILGSKGLRLGMAREEAVASISRVHSEEPIPESDDVRNKAVSELKLSIRARRTVENLGCMTLGEIAQHSEEELLGMPNFGVTSLLELRNKLNEFGLSLKGE
ncbi:MAG TPA: DNA-directed RNA polymerase subunit alpha C-terminal domain-containing protein, partial [Planctomycetota bacterium]|nr:DNA-directed RNA polymerase subunit alpha C-terminal domain-containing protein [Planctomycetota bacterium]